MFQVEWMLGDVTWLPYHQVNHLQALKTYLEALGVTSIQKLPLGMGQPPTDDPQVFTGSLSIHIEPPASYPYKTPLPLSNYLYQYFTIGPFPLPSVPPRSYAMTQSFAYLIRSSQNQFAQTDPATEYATVYTLDQIAEFIRFDRALRKGNKNGSNPSPAGYFDFARVYNLKPNVHTKFSLFDNNGAMLGRH
ncbi:hypothetical protein PLEOSDRAFT_157814 [Pleurotus ostreatus PC15]|uniref:Uncharacterized protein n=1 Tax=Pleurotus ostreatus (strain PC15) TaxID=1137138 RepID=A0A067NXL4_PLEO1|nr:hypothetical protein PLEOSDRAFT_157814 [Pleurotus ostreatus PC15]